MIILALLAIVFGVLLASRPARRPAGRRALPIGTGGAPEAAAEEPFAEAPVAEAPPAEEPAPPVPSLRLGDSFSRAEIRAMLGGSVQETFPHVGGRVVAGCFHPGYHPYAPFVVLPGWGPGIRRWAEALETQAEPIPCFLKRATNAWEYVGDFRVAGLVDDADEVAEWARIAEREGDVSMVLHLEEVEYEAIDGEEIEGDEGEGEEIEGA